MSKLNVHLVQTAPRWHDAAANRALFDEHLDSVSGDLAVLPEMFSTGFTMSAGEMCETMGGETVRWMSRAANERRLTLAGSVAIAEDGRCFNRFLWAQPGEPIVHYDKRHPFRMADEHEHYAPGTERVIVQLGEWRFLPVVCYDLRFPGVDAQPRQGWGARLRCDHLRRELARRPGIRLGCAAAGASGGEPVLRHRGQSRRGRWQ